LGDKQPAHVAATVALRRFQRAGLIYAREATRGERVFRITARGRRELALQRDVHRALARL
jgi:DNA-binding PadR family transcriptional regulator